jgi:hypothetical protein
LNEIVSHNATVDYNKTDKQCHPQIDMLAGTEELAVALLFDATMKGNVAGN